MFGAAPRRTERLRAVPTPPAISNMIVLDGIIDSSAENTTAEQQARQVELMAASRERQNKYS